MTPTRPKDWLTTDDLEASLEKLHRLQGLRIPTSPEAVAEAERRLSDTAPVIPSELQNPPALPATLSRRFSRSYWTHSSVDHLNTDNPVDLIARKARQLALWAIERGWAGPPYDPSALAEMMGISLLPTETVIDARTRSERGKFLIEFNPMRPAARLRFSIAHEIGHTLFPDCAEAIRNRATHEDMAGDEWQLEMLCNIAASEILMPIGSLSSASGFEPSVDSVLSHRRKFQVSSEAVLLRLLQLTTAKCFAFAAHREPDTNRYRVDYAIKSPGFVGKVPVETGFPLPKATHAAECTAIGFTAKASESWLRGEDWDTEYLGIAPYPGQVFPRVLGIVRSRDVAPSAPTIRYLKGDASTPRGRGPKILLQVVNDKAITWGAGFSRTLRAKWPSAQREFTNWAMSRRQDFRLGSVHRAMISDDLTLVSLVAQKGYGETDRPRIRYGALQQTLTSVSAIARQASASVHMPRIGTGLAGGDWAIVEEMIVQTLGQAGIDITVYDLPSQASTRRPPQISLFDVPPDSDQFL
jgi:Zn-dependent peptidase ImmA (M78 family)